VEQILPDAIVDVPRISDTGISGNMRELASEPLMLIDNYDDDHKK